MRIGVDACCWSNRRGFGRFTRELVSAMVRECPAHEFTLVVDRETAEECRFPNGARLAVVPTREQPVRAASAAGARHVTDVWRMGWASSRAGFDAFFFPAVYTFYPLYRRVPTVVTFHDAIAEQHPDLVFPGRRARLFWALKTWLARRQARRLLTVSESARDQIATAFGYPLSRIHVISEAPAAEFRPLANSERVGVVSQRLGLPRTGSLILYVGGLSPHKNLQGLIHAFARLRAEGEETHLVLVGDDASDSFLGCAPELRALSRELGLGRHVTLTGFVPDADLAVLYNAATCLVLPSLEEGFGLPAIEAMACGLPVAASYRGSLPELLGPAGLLFDPMDPHEIAGALTRLLRDAGLRERLRTEGLSRAQRFSWSAAARATVNLLEEVARER